MSAASEILVAVPAVINALEAVADAFGLDRTKVVRVAAGSLPELRESPPDVASTYFDAKAKASE